MIIYQWIVGQRVPICDHTVSLAWKSRGTLRMDVYWRGNPERHCVSTSIYGGISVTKRKTIYPLMLHVLRAFLLLPFPKPVLCVCVLMGPAANIILSLACFVVCGLKCSVTLPPPSDSLNKKKLCDSFD